MPTLPPQGLLASRSFFTGRRVNKEPSLSRRPVAPARHQRGPHNGPEIAHIDDGLATHRALGQNIVGVDVITNDETPARTVRLDCEVVAFHPIDRHHQYEAPERVLTDVRSR